MGRPESFQSLVLGEPAERPRNRQDHIQPLPRGLQALNLGATNNNNDFPLQLAWECFILWVWVLSGISGEIVPSGGTCSSSAAHYLSRG